MTAEDYVDAVRLLPCCVCGTTPVMAHHCLGGSMQEALGVRGTRKHSDFLTIPLCRNHHQGTDGLHQIGVRSWEMRYGFQTVFVDATGRRLGVDVWAEEEAERVPLRRPYKRLDKIVPRYVGKR